MHASDRECRQSLFFKQEYQMTWSSQILVSLSIQIDEVTQVQSSKNADTITRTCQQLGGRQLLVLQLFMCALRHESMIHV
jgi:hypothetical protein